MRGSLAASDSESRRIFQHYKMYQILHSFVPLETLNFLKHTDARSAPLETQLRVVNRLQKFVKNVADCLPSCLQFLTFFRSGSYESFCEKNFCEFQKVFEIC